MAAIKTTFFGWKGGNYEKEMAVSVICNSGHAGIEYYFYGWLTSDRRFF